MTKDFTPGLGFHLLTPLYDPVVALTTRDRRAKEDLVAGGAIAPGHRVLDLGCGTGTLALKVKRACPGADVLGVDADERMLSTARRKATRSAVAVRFDHGYAERLPCPDGTFDRVVSALFFHHLGPDKKRTALAEAFRVLVPGGALHIADWGPPAGRIARALFFSVRLLDGFSNTADHAAGRLPALLTGAGFEEVRVGERYQTVLGTLELVSGVKPSGTD